MPHLSCQVAATSNMRVLLVNWDFNICAARGLESAREAINSVSLKKSAVPVQKKRERGSSEPPSVSQVR